MSILPRRFEGANIRHVVVNSAIWICGKDVGEALDYANTRNACKTCVKDKYRKPLHQLIEARGMTPNERNAIYISESGLYQWLATSGRPKAEEFQDWLFEEALPKLRRQIFKDQLGIDNETQLHYKVVAFIRKYYPGALLIAGLGELQTTSDKRIDAWKKGYAAGQPDIIICNHHKDYSGYCIELKTPNGSGTVSQKQQNALLAYATSNYKTLVTNNFEEAIVDIISYMSNTRVCCPYCRRKFKSDKSMAHHIQGFHKA